MNTKLDCAADGERAMDMQAKTQCLGLLYQMDFAAHFLELLQPELQSTSEVRDISSTSGFCRVLFLCEQLTQYALCVVAECNNCGDKLLENCTPLITTVIVVYLSWLDRSDISFSLVRESNAVLTVFYSMVVELLEMFWEVGFEDWTNYRVIGYLLQSTNSFHEESICLQWLLDLGCASDLITTHFYVNNFR